jgi:hypothetical protein
VRRVAAQDSFCGASFLTDKLLVWRAGNAFDLKRCTGRARATNGNELAGQHVLTPDNDGTEGIHSFHPLIRFVDTAGYTTYLFFPGKAGNEAAQRIFSTGCNPSRFRNELTCIGSSR